MQGLGGKQPMRSTAPIRGDARQHRAIHSTLKKACRTMGQLEQRLSQGDVEFYFAYSIRAKDNHALLHVFSSAGVHVRCCRM